MQIIRESSASLNISMTAEPFQEKYHTTCIDIDSRNYIPLRNVIYDISGGATPTAKGDAYLEPDDEGAIPFLRIQNIGENKLIKENLNYINHDTHYIALKRSILKPNDVLVTITGRVGTACVVMDDFKGNINQHIVRFSVLPNFNPEFIAIFLNTHLGKLLTNRFVTGGTRIALDYDTLLNVPIPNLDIKHQNEIVKLHHSTTNKISGIYDKLNELVIHLRDSILKYITGEKFCNVVE